VKRAAHNQTVVLLVGVTALSVAAATWLGDLLEPSQPPAVRAVEIGKPAEPRGAAEPTKAQPERDGGKAGDRPASPARVPRNPAPPAATIPPSVDDDGGGDDDGD
jgi:hypothetical protein